MRHNEMRVRPRFYVAAGTREVAWGNRPPPPSPLLLLSVPLPPRFVSRPDKNMAQKRVPRRCGHRCNYTAGCNRSLERAGRWVGGRRAPLARGDESATTGRTRDGTFVLIKQSNFFISLILTRSAPSRARLASRFCASDGGFLRNGRAARDSRFCVRDGGFLRNSSARRYKNRNQLIARRERALVEN